jgi:hypothetical protein
MVMKKRLKVRIPNKKEFIEMVEKQPGLSIPDRGELIRRIEEEKDLSKLFGDLVKQHLKRGQVAWCCWWVCDGAAGGQCNCNCQMVETHCGCGDMGVPGLCQAGEQGPQI